MTKPGTNYNQRMASAARQAADGRLVLPSFQPPRPNVTGTCPDCKHPWSEHEDEGEGCLFGWGNPPAIGCMCMRA